MNTITILTILTLTLTNVLTNDLPQFNITPIFDRSGIFFNRLGQARISEDQFTLLSFINISIYEEKLNLVNKIYQISLPLCQGFRQNINKTNKQFEFTCSETLELIKNDLKVLDEKFDSICHLTGHNNINPRQKRGLINGVSHVFKWLFGTPDSDDAEYYTEAIESMSKQSDDMYKLMNQQVHILTDAIKEYNETANAISTNQNLLNDNIRIFNKFANSTAKRINSMTFAQKVTDHLNLLTLLANELNEEFDIVISSILFSKQNILHPNVITPRHLKDELSKIKLNSNLEFPYETQNIDNAHKYLEICTLSVFYSNKILIFAIKIPLVTKVSFNLFNLIPLPIPLTNSSIYSFINPTYPYLLLSNTKTYYSEMKDLSKCIFLPPSDYVCSQTTAYLVKERPTCEVDLKTKQLATIPKSCNTKVMNGFVEIWHPLNKNQWLFVVTNPTLGTVYCDTDNRITDANIKGVGIFTLKSRCKCYTLSATLIAKSDQTANYTYPMSTIDITMDECCQTKQDILQTEDMEPIRLENLNLNELNHADSKLRQINDELQRRIDQPFLYHASKWYNVLTGSITFIIIFLLVTWCCCRKFRWFPLRWLWNRCSRGPCQYLLCINSHNTISHSNVHSDTMKRTRRIPVEDYAPPGLTYAELHLEASRQEAELENDGYEVPASRASPEHTYEDIDLPEFRIPRRVTRSKTKKFLKI